MACSTPYKANTSHKIMPYRHPNPPRSVEEMSTGMIFQFNWMNLNHFLIPHQYAVCQINLLLIHWLVLAIVHCLRVFCRFRRIRQSPQQKTCLKIGYPPNPMLHHHIHSFSHRNGPMAILNPFQRHPDLNSCIEAHTRIVWPAASGQVAVPWRNGCAWHGDQPALESVPEASHGQPWPARCTLWSVTVCSSMIFNRIIFNKFQ